MLVLDSFLPDDVKLSRQRCFKEELQGSFEEIGNEKDICAYRKRALAFCRRIMGKCGIENVTLTRHRGLRKTANKLSNELV